jgi:hypothetical protein
MMYKDVIFYILSYSAKHLERMHLIQAMLYRLPPACRRMTIRPIASRCNNTANAALCHVVHRLQQGVLYIYEMLYGKCNF